MGGSPAAVPFSLAGASARHQSSSLRMMSAGDFSSWANARSAARSWPMIAAARAPRPSTSPMTMPTRPADSGMMSYQSPPTWVWMPWPCVSSGLAGTYRQATSRPSRSGIACGSRLFWKASAVCRSVLEQHRVVDRDGHPAGDGADQIAVGRVVVVLVAFGEPGQGQAHHAEQLAPGVERGGDRPTSARASCAAAMLSGLGAG